MAQRRAREELSEAARRIRAAVEEIETQWRDEASRRFTEQFWEPIDRDLKRYAVAAAELEKAIELIERDEA